MVNMDANESGGDNLLKSTRSDVDEDILNDVKNLFIDDEDDQVLNSASSENIYTAPEELKEKQTVEPELNLLKAPSDKKPAVEPTVTKDKPVIINKPPATTTTKQLEEGTKNPKDNKVTPKDDKVTKDPKNNKDTKAVNDKCKNNSDCDSNSYCIVKTGKCTAKLALNQAGCSSGDQCADSSAVCYSKTCMQSCKVGDDSVCEVAGQGCVKVNDMKVFEGIKGVNGVCDKIKASKPVVASGSNTKPPIAVICGSAALLLTALIVFFIYIRGHLKRRHRNTSPDIFLFNKLQRSTSQSLMTQPTDSAERLNARLSSVSGARFTRWAALSNENVA